MDERRRKSIREAEKERWHANRTEEAKSCLMGCGVIVVIIILLVVFL